MNIVDDTDLWKLIEFILWFKRIHFPFLITSYTNIPNTISSELCKCFTQFISTILSVSIENNRNVLMPIEICYGKLASARVVLYFHSAPTEKKTI